MNRQSRQQTVVVSLKIFARYLMGFKYSNEQPYLKRIPVTKYALHLHSKSFLTNPQRTKLYQI